MSILGGIFGKRNKAEETRPVPWRMLDSMEQIDEIISDSEEKLVAIFKHSTRCGTSRMALRAFESGFEADPDKAEVWFLDLLAHRAISDEVAVRFQVVHESPQLILVKKGKTFDHFSHYKITASALMQYL